MKPIHFALLLVVLMALATGWIFFDKIEDFLLSTEKISIQKPVEGKKIEPGHARRSERIAMPPRHPVVRDTAPITTEPQLVELPFPTTLAQSDAYLRERLQQVITDLDLLVLVNLNYFIQKMVLFIDHLPEKSIPRLHLPITPPKPGFVTIGSGEQLIISKRNFVRYTPYVRLVEAVPDVTLLQLYRGLYPLFQQAYREIGDPNGHFNDRLIQVIDELLETPESHAPIRVIHHVSRFKYADTSLESRSAGQKILLRMGVENAKRIKEKLQRLRKGLVRKDF